MLLSNKNIGLFFTLLILFSCHQTRVIVMQSNDISVDATIQENQQMQLFITPFRDSLMNSMNVVISYNKENIERNQPEGKLGNLTVDLLRNGVIERSILNHEKFPVIAILNNGGLRSPILAGDVTVGSIFQLMPFDNEVVYLRLPVAVLPPLHKVMLRKGGEPIAGAMISDSLIHMEYKETMHLDSFWLVTSDYLAQGNDGFEVLKEFEYQSAEILLRDLFLEEIVKMDTIQATIDGRWSVNKME